MSDEKLFRVTVTKDMFVVARSPEEAAGEAIAHAKEDDGRFEAALTGPVDHLNQISHEAMYSRPWGTEGDKRCAEYVADQAKQALIDRIEASKRVVANEVERVAGLERQLKALS